MSLLNKLVASKKVSAEKMLRGQYQVLEQVILFGIGLIMLASVFSIFSLLGDRIRTVSTHDNFQDVGLFVAANLVEAYTQGKYFHNLTIVVPVPRSAGGVAYQLSINDNGVRVNATDNDAYRASSGVYNINRTAGAMDGAELSTQSPLKIIFSNYTRGAVLQR
ncbi:MAG: hypothetical protein HY516_01530 [Candidatus Aenigmarchaeota archaeon]|nr:hypothetical protein [Candidatus Aenigmarchaeota archaeon]